MAPRRPNYNFERKQREEKKAAKKRAKLEKARAKKGDRDTGNDLGASPDQLGDMKD